MLKTNTRPVIAVDIDDVLFPFVLGMAEYHNHHKGTTLSPEDFTSFNFMDVWGGTQDETNSMIDGFMEADYLRLQPEPGAKEALARLKNDFDVVLVTARNQMFEANTVLWLRHHLPDLFKDVVFAGNPHDGRAYQPKGIICKELGARLLIDDHPLNLMSATECGVEGILFGSKAWSVVDGPYPSIKACPDWPSVIEYIYHEWR
jgi:5'(3')-deoxyribonucleotidase